jgi:hypothetical protein
MPWVVYEMRLHNHESRNAVCEQDEWEALELARPGYHKLLHADIASETEAERLARGTSGDPKPRQPRQATPAFTKVASPHPVLAARSPASPSR